MGEPAMILDDEQLEKIGEYVKSHLHEWLPPKSARELELIERFAVIETEKKNLGIRMDERFEAMEQRFVAMDQRFVALQRQLEERFEAMDHRFDAMQARFEVIDTRFEALQRQMDDRFEAVNQRFEALQRQMDYRFDAMQKQMDERFNAVDRRFDAVDRRFVSMQWFMGIGFTVLALLMSVYQYL